MPDLYALLGKSDPNPSGFLHGEDEDSAALLVLAIHCVMVNEGFQTVTEGSTNKKGNLKPPAKWSSLPTFWSFQYSHPHATNQFQLNTANNRGKLFVQLREVNHPPNTRVLGLQVDKYVCCDYDEARKPGVKWNALLRDTDRLFGMLQEHILTPLTGTMMQKPEKDRESVYSVGNMHEMLLGSDGCLWNWKTQMIAGVTVAAVAVVVVRLRASKSN